MTSFEREFAMLLRWALYAIVAGALLVVGITAGGMKACAHEAPPTAGQPLGWRYSAWCCSDRDCKPLPASGIRETPNGYALQSTGEVVPYQDKRVKESPDGTFHVCQQAGDFDHGRVLCIYAPGRGD